MVTVIADVCRLRVSECCYCCMPTHHSPSTLQSPLRHLHTGSGSSHGGSPVFVAAKPRQANRCWPRAYLIPPGIILILVSHAFDPTYCNPRYRAPVTLPPPLLLWARRSKDDCARSSSCRHYIHTSSSLQQRNKSTPHARAKRVESQARPRWSLAAEALRLETGTSLCYLWS